MPYSLLQPTLIAASWCVAEDIQPWDRNPRHNEEAIPRVKASILRFGFGAPLLVWPTPEGRPRLIAGHTRLMAYHQLRAEKGAHFCPQGCPEPGLIPVRWMDHLSESEANALALADNQLASLATWDEDLLQEILADLQPEFSLSLLGFPEGAPPEAAPMEVEEETPPGNGRDSDEESILFDGYTIPLSEEEVEKLRERLQEHLAEKGELRDFFLSLFQN